MIDTMLELTTQRRSLLPFNNDSPQLQADVRNMADLGTFETVCFGAQKQKIRHSDRIYLMVTSAAIAAVRALR